MDHEIVIIYIMEYYLAIGTKTWGLNVNAGHHVR
jgi:hypothetical protein